jgi:5'-3' exonuclease
MAYVIKIMILLVDADSLVWSSCFKKREHKEDNPYFENIEDATAKFDEVFMSIVNKIEAIYPVDDYLLFNNSRGNFRTKISKTYKANRKNQPRPELLGQVHNFVTKQYGGIAEAGVETDDVVAKYWFNMTQEYGRNEVMIVSIDKDYKQFPCLMYNYHIKHQCVHDITEEEALYNFYEQMIIGDTADNVNYCKGYGVKFTEKYLVDCVTKYQYTRKVFELFKKIHKSKAREKYLLCYNLLKLRTN